MQIENLLEPLFCACKKDCEDYLKISGYKVEDGAVCFKDPGQNNHTKFRQAECKQIEMLWARGPGRLRKDFIKLGLAIPDEEMAKKKHEPEKERKRPLAGGEAQSKDEAEERKNGGQGECVVGAFGRRGVAGC